MEQHLVAVGRQMDGLLGGLYSRVAATEQRLEAVEARLVEAQRTISELRWQVEQLEGRFTVVLADLHQHSNPDALQPAAWAHHEAVAHDLDSLCTDVWHDLQSVALMQGGSRRGRAKLMAEVMTAFFGGPAQSDDGQLARLFGDENVIELLRPLSGTAAALRQRAAEHGSGAVFDFDVADESLDQDRQRVWGACDPGGRVEFAVTPGYRLGHRILRLQEVWTFTPDVSYQNDTLPEQAVAGERRD